MFAAEFMSIRFYSSFLMAGIPLRVDRLILWLWQGIISQVIDLAGLRLKVKFKLRVFEGTTIIMPQRITIVLNACIRLVICIFHFLIQFVCKSINKALKQFFLTFRIGPQMGIECMKVSSKLEGKRSIQFKDSANELGQITKKTLHNMLIAVNYLILQQLS